MRCVQQTMLSHAPSWAGLHTSSRGTEIKNKLLFSSIFSENSGSQADFDNELPVACGPQCNADVNSPCFIPCSLCDGQQVAGTDTPVTRRYNMNTTAAKNILFSYETYSIKDRMTVSYEGANLFDSGCVGTQGERYTPISYDG